MNRVTPRKLPADVRGHDGYPSLAGAVLAGGRSSRMGRFKEGILLQDRRPMIEHVIGALASVCGSVVIVGACSGYTVKTSAGIRQIPDNYPGHGPMAGLEALLSSGIADGYLVAACDQPLITPQLLRRLVDGERTIPAIYTDTAGEVLCPLPGYYPATLVDSVQSDLREGRRSVVGFLSRVVLRPIPVDGRTIELLRSYNTPDEIAPLLGC